MSLTDTKQIKGLGAFLRSQREAKHITIEQVASATKINIKLLHALESDNYNELPAKPFVRGFVLNYSRYLGLDTQHILREYGGFLEEKTRVKFKHPENLPHIFVERHGTRDNSKTILAVVMGSFLILAIISFVVLKPKLKQKHHATKEKPITNEQIYTVVLPPDTNQRPAAPPTEIKPASPVTAPPVSIAVNTDNSAKPATASTKEVIASPKPNEPNTPESTSPTAELKPKTVDIKPIQKEVSTPTKWPIIPPGEVRQLIVARAVEDTWIRYQADGFSVREYTLKKGQKIFIRARNNIRFRSYRTHGIEVSFDNKDFKTAEDQTIIVPSSEVARYKDRPFIQDNRSELSTGTP